MTRDADAALAASGDHLTEASQRAEEKHRRASRMRWLLQSNHFAEAFRRELEGGRE